MFSFAGDVVFDPFLGSVTTTIAAWRSGRNSVGIELDQVYLKQAISRFQRESALLGSTCSVRMFGNVQEAA
jgi:DNA modification methylase